jgi:hypothetical protein
MPSDEPVEQQYLDHFMQFLEKNNIVGLDYWEFATTLHKVYEKNGAALSEEALYDMAYMLFESQGVTSDMLVQTAEKYLEMVNTHKKEFDSFLANEGSKSVQNKTAENAKLEQANANATAQMATLQKQIAALQTSITTNTVTIKANLTFITAEQEKNKAKKAKFEAAFEVVVNKIKGDIQKIKSYLNK